MEHALECLVWVESCYTHVGFVSKPPRTFCVHWQSLLAPRFRALCLSSEQELKIAKPHSSRVQDRVVGHHTDEEYRGVVSFPKSDLAHSRRPDLGRVTNTKFTEVCF